MILADLDPNDGRVNLQIEVAEHTRNAYELRYYRPDLNGRGDVLLLELPASILGQKSQGVSIYVPLIRIKDIHKKEKYYTTYLGKTLLDAWSASLDREKAAKTALLKGLAEVDSNVAYVTDRNQLDIVARALAELPLGALAELSVTAYTSSSPGSADTAATTGSWKLDGKNGNPRAYITSVSADPRGEMTLYAVCWNGEFVLAMDNEYEGHKYFDYEDFVPDGGMDITPVVLSFGGADNQFLFWYRPDPDELQSPNQFLRAWGGLNRGEMDLSGRGDFSIFRTDWDARAVFRKIISGDRMALKTWGIPRDEYLAWFEPRASLAKLTAHLSCY